MVSHAAQGAGMCIEDAAVLSELYRHEIPSDPARAANLARTYQGMRRPRTDKVQHRARMAGMTWAIANPDQQRKRDDGLEALEQKKGRAKADENARPSSIAFEVWLEDYAALAEADKALQDMQKVQARL